MMLLRPEPEELEEQEEDDPDYWYKSEHECPCCQEQLTYTDEIFLLEISEAAQDDGSLVYQPVVCDDGDYQYTPYILHLECWEEVTEQIQSARKDEPPAQAGNGILVCTQCESTITAFEPFAASTFGEIQVSQRRPSGEAAEKILRLDKMKPVCLACIVHVFEDHFEDWEDLFDGLTETLGEDE